MFNYNSYSRGFMITFQQFFMKRKIIHIFKALSESRKLENLKICISLKVSVYLKSIND